MGLAPGLVAAAPLLDELVVHVVAVVVSRGDEEGYLMMMMMLMVEVTEIQQVRRILAAAQPPQPQVRQHLRFWRRCGCFLRFLTPTFGCFLRRTKNRLRLNFLSTGRVSYGFLRCFLRFLTMFSGCFVRRYFDHKTRRRGPEEATRTLSASCRRTRH